MLPEPLEGTPLCTLESPHSRLREWETELEASLTIWEGRQRDFALCNKRGRNFVSHCSLMRFNCTTTFATATSFVRESTRENFEERPALNTTTFVCLQI